jgi:hypothetical protein
MINILNLEGQNIVIQKSQKLKYCLLINGGSLNILLEDPYLS